LGDPARQFVASWGIWLFRQTGLGSKHSRPLADEMLDVADREGSVELRLQAHHAAWTTFVWGGDPRTGDEHVRRGLALYDLHKHGDHAARYGGHDPAVCGHGQGAVARWLLGLPDRAVGDVERAIAHGKQLNHPPSIAHALVWGSWVHQFRREHEATKARADEAFTIASAQGLGGYIAMALVARGWARAMEGDTGNGLEEIDGGLKTFRAVGMQMSVSYFLALYAEALVKAGRIDAAFDKIVEARASIPDSGEHFWEADLTRLAGEIALLKDGKAEDEAAAHFADSIEIARRQNARALELRAATSLARLLQRQGKSDEGRALVAPVFEAFTEGRGTADLLQAESLLSRPG
jgi:predicted ATPase